ncbi:putative membrane protein [Winogradskyella psychrotolerans RS-3]|uniref:Putative membrane protein n=2 Tax=Winogradskyella TaxID=286104 RepID=S7VTD7_9FLAO|nr:putative membrane protein [Winogradskyella psychrotolerans RS-3]
MILGILGSFLPVLPGPLTSWAGLLVLHFTEGVELSQTFLIVTLVFAVFIYVLDYIIPAIGTKRFGGSKAGMIGTTLGLVIGLFSPIPFGIIIGPFVGALIGEMMHRNDFNKALKAAFGSFLGFIASTFLKFIVAIIYLGFFIVKLSEHNVSWY